MPSHMSNKTKIIIYLTILLAVIAGGIYFISKIGDMEGEIEGVDFNVEQEKISQPSQPEESEQVQAPESDQPKIMAEILKEGTGEVAKKGDKITAHYNGYLEDGTKFDSSIDRGQPFQFDLGAGQVILGWELGIAGMKVGEIRRLIIPSVFAYGEQGIPGAIPPNAILVFEVELLGVN